VARSPCILHAIWDRIDNGLNLGRPITADEEIEALSMTRTITLEEFSDLLDRLGDVLADWPADQRTAAETLLTQSAEARQRLAQAVEMGDALRAAQPKAPSGLVDRILAASGAPVPSANRIKRTVG